MQEEKYRRLRHWWEAFQESLKSSNEEALRRKLHLLQAEIRKTLRESAPGRTKTRRKVSPVLSFSTTIVLLALLIALLYFPLMHTPIETNTATTVQATLSEPLPLTNASTVLTPPSLPTFEDASATKTAPGKSEQRPAAHHPRPQAQSRRGPPGPKVSAASPLASPSPPTFAPASPASIEEATQEPLAPAGQELQLDPLALLVALEGELEK